MRKIDSSGNANRATALICRNTAISPGNPASIIWTMCSSDYLRRLVRSIWVCRKTTAVTSAKLLLRAKRLNARVIIQVKAINKIR